MLLTSDRANIVMAAHASADVLEALLATLEQDLSLVVPTTEAVQRLALAPAQRMCAVDAIMQQLGSVAPEGIAATTAFALQHCQAGEHALEVCKVCCVLPASQ